MGCWILKHQLSLKCEKSKASFPTSIVLKIHYRIHSSKNTRYWQVQRAIIFKKIIEACCVVFKWKKKKSAPITSPSHPWEQWWCWVKTSTPKGQPLLIFGVIFKYIFIKLIYGSIIWKSNILGVLNLYHCYVPLSSTFFHSSVFTLVILIFWLVLSTDK